MAAERQEVSVPGHPEGCGCSDARREEIRREMRACEEKFERAEKLRRELLEAYLADLMRPKLGPLVIITGI